MTQPLPLPRHLLDDSRSRAATRINVLLKTDRFAGPEGCWIWQGAKFHYGHGYINAARDDGSRRKVMVHRLMYAWENGDSDLPIDHMCGNPSCVNPLHLQAVTVRINSLRGSGPASENAQKTHCIKGHPLYGDNLQIVGGSRRCRACANERNRISKDKNNYGSGGKGTRKFRRNSDAKTHCKNGHPWTPENIYRRTRGQTECRACHREREARRQQRLRNVHDSV